ncbi:MAG: hypothetical protein HY094_04025 [Candidatus Melainabacteria bacterium]|nr:hypothetical protein [Candidatus Melainabacteria bacterium]
MSIVIINDTVQANISPLLEILAKRYGRTKLYSEVIPELEQGKIELEPGDYLACATARGLQNANLGIIQLQRFLVEYLSQSIDAELIYNGLTLPKALQAGEELAGVGVDDSYNFERPGDTKTVESENLNIIFPSSDISPIDKYDKNLVSLSGFNPESSGGGRLEITHIGGFEKERVIKIPTHLETEEGVYEPAILFCTVKFPKAPKQKLVEISTTIDEDSSSIIDIGKLGLHVPHGDTTFTIRIKFDQAGISCYSLRPRSINGLLIDPQESGKNLEVRLAYKTTEKTKTILTHIYNQKDEVVPVKLTVNIKQSK